MELLSARPALAPSRRRPARRHLPWLAALLPVLAWVGCYNPQIVDGGLVCADAGEACPDGFHCNPVDHRCHKAVPQCSTAPVTALCQEQPSAGTACNPTCQTGCACGRCNVAGTAAVCTETVGTKQLSQVCTTGSDDCAPGLICLLESCGAQLGRCYRHCTSASQCQSGVACQLPILDSAGNDTNFKTCDLAPETCDPVARTGCLNAALNCYLDSGGATFCDCPSGNTPVAQGGACTGYNDCAAGLACVSVAGVTGLRCRQLCTQARSTCNNGQRCIPAGATYGYCGA
jgi:hypothetical protein